MKKKDELLPKTTATQEIDDSKSICTNFTLQQEFWSITPPEYKDLTEFTNFPSYIEAVLNKIVAKNPVVDEGNKEMLDHCIADITKKNIDYLKKQSIEHAFIINKIVRQANASEVALRMHVESVERDYERTKAEYEELIARYNKGTKDSKFIKSLKEETV